MQQRFMNMSVRGQQLFLVTRKGLVFEIGNGSTRFFNDYFACCGIPGAEVKFPKAFKPPGSHPAHINRGAAQPAYWNALCYQF